MTRQKKPHVFLGKNSFRCFNCGEELFFPVSSQSGFSLSIITSLGKAVEKDHQHCKPSAAGKARFEYTNLDEWFKSWDTGTSSLALYAVLTGQVVLSSTPGPPRDPSDFGRCYRLLQLVDVTKQRDTLEKAADRYPQWKSTVAAWNELTTLWEEETKNLDGTAPKLHKRMQELAT